MMSARGPSVATCQCFEALDRITVSHMGFTTTSVT